MTELTDLQADVAQAQAEKTAAQTALTDAQALVALTESAYVIADQ